jgi:hypothetical protein
MKLTDDRSSVSVLHKEPVTLTHRNVTNGMMGEWVSNVLKSNGRSRLPQT